MRAHHIQQPLVRSDGYPCQDLSSDSSPSEEGCEPDAVMHPSWPGPDLANPSKLTLPPWSHPESGSLVTPWVRPMVARGSSCGQQEGSPLGPPLSMSISTSSGRTVLPRRQPSDEVGTTGGHGGQGHRRRCCYRGGRTLQGSQDERGFTI